MKSYKNNFALIVDSKERKENAIAKKGRKILSAFLLCSFCFGLSTATTFAASEYPENQDTITMNEAGAIETYIGNFATEQTFTPEQDTTTVNQEDSNNGLKAAEPTISDIKKTKMNLFETVSDYVAYPGTVSVSKGVSTTISASVTGGGGVDIKFLKLNLSKTVGDSVTFTTTQTTSYPVSKGMRGRIILRYSQDYYTYKITKSGKDYTGSATTQAYDQYYALQEVSLG
ncbi:hypothetical protein [Paenibacillus azoreducens]|uniref:Uncharacterized protein n=1 Tax=Paenibacillus azoreducens TaxID=116718 RepID=A0A919YEA5_9BACL|nr:hypothetical protein [Paenibacillus azoreducens]GIO50076.1 hypothetical protein J34TS1_48410 [Paenibacillus azoreducens]